MWILSLLMILMMWCGGAECSSFSYYDDTGRKGWWWYEVTPKKEEEVKKVYNETFIPPVTTLPPSEREQEEKKESEFRIRPLHEYSYEELLYMPVEEFRKIFEYYKNKAISEPTEENVFYYFNLVDVLRKKAFLFSSMFSYVAQKYSQYLPSSVYPVSVPGIGARLNIQREEIERKVYGRAGDYGLLLFVRSGCRFCDVQYEILKRLISNGVRIKVVDISNRGDLVSKFGIETVPTLVLVHRNGSYIPISSGVEPLDTIMFKIYRGLAILEGEDPGRYGLYEFQKGSPLDPFEPSPLWKKNNRQ